MGIHPIDLHQVQVGIILNLSGMIGIAIDGRVVLEFLKKRLPAHRHLVLKPENARAPWYYRVKEVTPNGASG